VAQLGYFFFEGATYVLLHWEQLLLTAVLKSGCKGTKMGYFKVVLHFIILSAPVAKKNDI
jgi:hypothetical protein